MELLKALLLSFPLSLITVAVEYRFICKTLERKTSGILTFGIMLIVYIAANGLNMRYLFAKSVGINTLYYCILTFILYLVLFKGSIVKKLFFTVFISYGVPITFYVLMPFVSCFFGKNSRDYLLVLKILEYVNILFTVVILEYMGKRFQNLRRELPTGYTLYLTVVLLFVHVAVFFGYDVIFVRNSGIRNILRSNPEALILGSENRIYHCPYCEDLQTNYYFEIHYGNEKYYPHYFCPRCETDMEPLDVHWKTMCSEPLHFFNHKGKPTILSCPDCGSKAITSCSGSMDWD